MRWASAEQAGAGLDSPWAPRRTARGTSRVGSGERTIARHLARSSSGDAGEGGRLSSSALKTSTSWLNRAGMAAGRAGAKAAVWAALGSSGARRGKQALITLAERHGRTCRQSLLGGFGEAQSRLQRVGSQQRARQQQQLALEVALGACMAGKAMLWVGCSHCHLGALHMPAQSSRCSAAHHRQPQGGWHACVPSARPSRSRWAG